jgi:hypothetical protein
METYNFLISTPNPQTFEPQQKYLLFLKSHLGYHGNVNEAEYEHLPTMHEWWNMKLLGHMV